MCVLRKYILYEQKVVKEKKGRWDKEGRVRERSKFKNKKENKGTYGGKKILKWRWTMNREWDWVRERV